jgi:uncharacterized protein
MEPQTEIRIIPDELAEVRSIGDSRQVEGLGIVFGKESLDLGGFTEIIDPGAIDGVIERSDILALLNHDISKGVLARSIKGKGSLALKVEKRGVKYSFDAPQFDLGNELLDGIRRGDIKQSSFSFSVLEDKWTKRKDGSILRTVLKFDKLGDVSPTYRAAYSDTTVALRSLDLVKQADNFSVENSENPGIGEVQRNLQNEPERIITEREIRLKRINDKFKLKNKKR